MHIGDLNRDAAGRLLRSGMTDYERWLQFVSFQDGTQCWMWTGGITSSGHGNFRIKLADGWKQIGAHVYSYIHHHGPVPIGENGKPLVIRHSCDIRPCVNPNLPIARNAKAKYARHDSTQSRTHAIWTSRTRRLLPILGVSHESSFHHTNPQSSRRE
jgi:hypothetical protein